MYNYDKFIFSICKTGNQMIFQTLTSLWKNIEIASELGMECILKKKLKMEVSKFSMMRLDVEGCKLWSE